MTDSPNQAATDLTTALSAFSRAMRARNKRKRINPFAANRVRHKGIRGTFKSLGRFGRTQFASR